MVSLVVVGEGVVMYLDPLGGSVVLPRTEVLTWTGSVSSVAVSSPCAVTLSPGVPVECQGFRLELRETTDPQRESLTLMHGITGYLGFIVGVLLWVVLMKSWRSNSWHW